MKPAFFLLKTVPRALMVLLTAYTGVILYLSSRPGAAPLFNASGKKFAFVWGLAWIGYWIYEENRLKRLEKTSAKHT